MKILQARSAVKRTSFRPLSGLLVGLLSTCSVSCAATTTTTTTTTTTDTQTQKVVVAANAFRAILDATQKTKVSFAFDDAAQRVRWSNLPTGIFQRVGLRWGDLSVAQRTSLGTLLSTVLSADGYRMVQQQMEADEVLKSTSGGGKLIFGQDEYYVSFLGTPSSTEPWILQFGGHHLALNITVVGANITLAPSLTGGQPTTYTAGGRTVRIVGQEVQDALALVTSLNTSQKSKAVIGSQTIDLVMGPGQDGKALQAEGLPALEMTASQKTALLKLIRDRVGAVNTDDLTLRMAELEKNLDKTYFAWYGPTTAGSAAYFRVTGPTVLLEFSPQQMGGDATNHIHSMYRDPTNDYGANWIKLRKK